MDLTQLEQIISSNSGNAYPLEKWHPSNEQVMDLHITANGDWIHQGSKIKREKLVKLFSKILIKEGQYYYLLTPAEKLRIEVQDAAFVIVDFTVEKNEHDQQVIWLVSNIGDNIPMSDQYPLQLRGDKERPYVKLWRGLDALIERNTYYQLVELALSQQTDDASAQLILHSDNVEFQLGALI